MPSTAVLYSSLPDFHCTMKAGGVLVVGRVDTNPAAFQGGCPSGYSCSYAEVCGRCRHESRRVGQPDRDFGSRARVIVCVQSLDAERIGAGGNEVVGEVSVAGATKACNYEPGAVGAAGGVAVDPFSGELEAGLVVTLVRIRLGKSISIISLRDGDGFAGVVPIEYRGRRHGWLTRRRRS